MKRFGLVLMGTVIFLICGGVLMTTCHATLQGNRVFTKDELIKYDDLPRGEYVVDEVLDPSLGIAKVKMTKDDDGNPVLHSPTFVVVRMPENELVFGYIFNIGGPGQ